LTSIGTSAVCRPYSSLSRLDRREKFFTRNDLDQILAKIADRDPDLRLAA
jgi:hypothetical protein